MRLALIAIGSILISCKAAKVIQHSDIIVLFETEQTCDRGYILVKGGDYFSRQGSILKDTCNTPFTSFLQSARSNYIPKISDIFNLENALHKKEDLKEYYRLYSGFVTHENDTVVEALMLEPAIVNKRGDTWRSERFQTDASPPFPLKKSKNQKKLLFCFNLNKSALVDGSDILRYRF